MPKEKSLTDFLEATLFITNQNPKLDREMRVHSLVIKYFMEYLTFHVEKKLLIRQKEKTPRTAGVK